MTDVLKIALDRRAELNEEIEKLDDFIRMAESLIRGSQHSAPHSTENEMPRRPAQVAEPVVRTAIRRAEAEDIAEDHAVQRPQVIRRTSQGSMAANS